MLVFQFVGGKHSSSECSMVDLTDLVDLVVLAKFGVLVELDWLN